MHTAFRGALFAAFATALSGCATPPEEIQASVISPVLYDYLNCGQLADYASSLEATYNLAADQQDKARYEDVIGYVILQQPLGSERRSSVPGEIAELKGRIEAVRELQSSKTCGQQQVSLTTGPSSAEAR
jgi:hypothetical protein